MVDYEVKCIRLNTGEVIMGFTKVLKNLNYEIIEPQIILTTADQGKMEVNFAPWIPYAADYEFVIEKSQVQTIFKPRPQLETNYKVATGNNVRGQIQK